MEPEREAVGIILGRNYSLHTYYCTSAHMYCMFLISPWSLHNPALSSLIA